jgi:SAM-dependent methyltransferase
MIPRILHYCFGMAPDFGGQPWSLVHYVCAKSAIERLKPSRVYFWCEYLPKGPWWRLTEDMVEVVQIKAPRTIFGTPLHHPAHRADIVRLDKLLEHGGIYLDADVFVHRHFDDLLHHRVVMGEQDKRGLCNAVLLAEPGASFVQRWREEYRSFRSEGKDEFWDEHSVQVPMRLVNEFPDEVTKLEPSAFFWPSWNEIGVERIFASADPIPPTSRYANHLWESRAWDKYLENLTPHRVRMIDSNFHFWARPMISALPDNYGSAGVVSGAIKRIRKATVKRIGEGVTRIRRPVVMKILSPAWHATSRTISSLFPGSRFAGLYRRRTFRNVYERRLWGTDKFGVYFSGVGSIGEPAKVYVDAMVPIIADMMRSFGNETTVVDLGCGDFRIGAALLERLPPLRYVGCDLVPELVAENSRRYGSRNISFRCLDIVGEDLPPGHIYLVRQVLQHLPNRDIARVLGKLRYCKDVYVTEGQPETLEGLVNPDKPIGADVRFNWRTGRGRGVELDQHPFGLHIEEVCRASSDPKLCREVIVTYRVHFKAERDSCLSMHPRAKDRTRAEEVTRVPLQ